MKRALLFIACVLASLTMSAQEGLIVGDIQNSGCLAKARGDAPEPLPTIVLTKEGSVLSVQLLNYESNCATTDFNVTSAVSGGSDSEPCSVNISVVPYIPDDLATDCLCPYNVSFTVCDVEANSFYLSCWWYEGLVTLEDGKPLMLEDILEEVIIDGMKYTLRKAMSRAMLEDGSTQKGEVRIPAELNHGGKTYSVTGISISAFSNNKDLTKVVIPKTIKNTDLSNDIGIGSNPFSGCTALQSIEVEDGNPAVCSVDGVLFNKEKTKLLSYPVGAPRESYTVPESVTWIEGLAFSYSPHLRKVTLTDNVTMLGYSAFYECKSLEEVRLPTGLKTLANYLFGNCQRLKSVTIPQGVTHLGLKAFEGCSSLTSVTMPESITSTDYSVFDGCTSLESVTLSTNLERIMNNMFANCSSLKELLIPNGITIVGSEAFKNCSALTSLDLPESVNRLGSMIFAGCKLSSLYIRGVIDSNMMSSNIFRDMNTSAKLYVLSSEVEKFKAIYNGPVYPLPGQIFDDIADVKIDETTFPDKDFRNWVLSQEYGKDGKLTKEEIARVTFMNIFPQNIIAEGHIKSLKGIEYFTAVTRLVCSRNELTELDLSKNTELTRLECDQNHLTELDLSKNTELTYLDCNYNKLTALDVSCCNKLTELNCFGNKLTTLNVSGCNALTNLKCYSNQLAVIDLSGCTSLATMWAFDNLLSALNVLDCTSLSTLWCEDNKLPQLDVSNNTELKELRCNDNQLTVLDLSENKMLTSLRTYHNPIKGEAMDALIESLPTASRGGWCCVLSEDEVGVVTTSQVAAAKLKGWTSYYWNEAAKSWMEYVGSEAVQNDYRPLLAEGKVWTYRYNNGVRQYMKSLTIGGDTIIGNQTYKKIIDVASQAVEMSLREEDKKVYCCYPSRDTEILLYDFSKNAGEIISKEIKNGDTYIQKVTSVDNIMVNDKVFRCMTVHEYVIPEGMSEEEYFAGNYGYESGFWIEGIGSFAYLSSPIPYDGNYYSFYECQIDDVTYNQKDFLDAIKNDTQPTYRPFVEDSKVWKVGAITSGNPVQLVEYYYFDGDTIIDGKTCKQMMCQRYVTPDFAESNFISQDPPLCYVGAWYEEDKKVYEYDTKSKQFKMMYDFSIDANDTLQIGHYSYVIGPRTTGGIKGFKGVYREVRECREVWDCGDGVISFRCAPWLEGVGIVYGPPTLNVLNVELADPMWFLMSCTVGDEVIYLNDEYEDGATPESAGARKRFDFTHTTKPKPKAPIKRGEAGDAEASGMQSLYGEYNDLQLGINLDPLSDAYLVRITDESGKAVYEKTVNAGNIVALNIDISAYAKGHYTVIVENSQETFTGEFETLTSEIRDVRCKKEDGRSIIYNLQGQRLHSLQKGLNIVNGQKVFVK